MLKQNHSYRSKRIVLTLIILMGILAMVFGFMSFRGTFPEKVESITIGGIDDITNTLIFIAEERGFFTTNGLNVTFQKYETGSAASDAIIKGEVDIALMTEFVIVEKSFQKENVSIIATRDKFESIYLVARKDRGIENFASLKGKRIGLPRQSINEFYLGRFLDRNSMNLQDVILVDIKPAQSPNAFSSGNVDGVVVRQSFVDQITRQYPGKIASWPVQSDQPVFGVMSSMKEWIAQHPELVKRFLNSLIQAEDYLINNPAETKAMVQKRLKIDDSFMDSVWPQHQFSLSLDLSLITAMTDEARWMIANNLTAEKAAPNFLDYIYVEGLKAVKPGAVNIIR